MNDDRASIEELVRKMYNSEYEENLHSTKRGLSVEDREWLQMVESSMEKQNGHYTPALPVKKPEEKMADNLKFAKTLLESLRTRMKQDKKLAADYKTLMGEMISKGYAEKIYSQMRQRQGPEVRQSDNFCTSPARARPRTEESGREIRRVGNKRNVLSQHRLQV